jgi:hypothetical protein
MSATAFGALTRKRQEAGKKKSCLAATAVPFVLNNSPAKRQ